MTSLFKIIDRFVGRFLIALLAPFGGSRGEGTVATPRSVLVVRLWTLGETLLTFPMISALRRKYPGARIAVLCRRANRPAVALCPDADETVLFEPGRLAALAAAFRRYDLAIDTEPWFRVSALLSFWMAKERIGFSHGARARLYTRRVPFDDRVYEARAFLGLLSPLGADARFERLGPVTVPAGESGKVDALLAAAGIPAGGIVVGICPGAEDALYRMWPAERFAALARHLADRHGASVVIVGSPRETDLCENVLRLADRPERIFNLAGKTGIPGLFSLIGRMSLLVTNDTGPMHVAAAVGTKTVSLFGPNLPERFAPRTPGSIAIFHGDGERPLINVHKGEIPSGNDPEYFEPIRRITEDEVKAAADAILSRGREPGS